MQPKKQNLEKAIAQTVANGNSLLEDAKFLFDFERFSTSLALAVLAQEEFAKAFLLQLVFDEALPWIPEVRQSMARHQCKHLMAIVMDWVPDMDDVDDLIERHRRRSERHERLMNWYKRTKERYDRGVFEPDPNDPKPVDPQIEFPQEVADALNIYRHEQIERMTKRRYAQEAPDAKGMARKLADGALDRKKQSALYVDITSTGEVGLHPGLVTKEDAENAIKRARELSESRDRFSDEYQGLEKILPIVFASLSRESHDTEAE